MFKVKYFKNKGDFEKRTELHTTRVDKSRLDYMKSSKQYVVVESVKVC
jgi:hypothetical protein